MISLRTVLCPIDFTPLSEEALGLAGHVAQRFSSRLLLQHHLGTAPPATDSAGRGSASLAPSAPSDPEVEARAGLEEAAGRVPPGVSVETTLTRGSLDGSILRLAQTVGADLLVMATHDLEVAGRASMTEAVLRRVPCPLLALRESRVPHSAGDLLAPDREEPIEVLVPVDLTPQSQGTLEYAFSLAQVIPSRLHLLHVEGLRSLRDVRSLDPSELPRRRHDRVEAAARRLRERVPSELAERTQVHVMVGPRVEQILATAEMLEIDLIVSGVRPSAFRPFAASSACILLHSSPCPVWYVPSRGVWAWRGDESAASRTTRSR